MRQPELAWVEPEAALDFPSVIGSEAPRLRQFPQHREATEALLASSESSSTISGLPREMRR